MLQALRSRASGIIAKVLFVLLIASFGVWGIDGSFFSGDPGPVVATVGERDITDAELTNLVRRNLQPFRGAITDRQARDLGMVDAALDQLIDSAAVDLAALDAGLDASDTQVVTGIRASPAFRNELGDFDRFRYEQALRQIGLSEAHYVDMIRGEVRATMFAGSAVAGARGPSPLVDHLRAYRGERRRVELLAIPADRFVDLPAPDPTAIRRIYDENQSEFMTPDLRTLGFVALDIDTLAATVEIDPAEVEQAYRDRLDDFSTPERRAVTQVIGDRADMEAVAALVGDGQTFAAAVAAAGQQPVDLGLVTRDDMLPELVDIAFSLDAGSSSGAVQSPFGWHVLHVGAVEAAATEPFEAVRDAITLDLQRDVALGRVGDLADQLEDLVAGGASLDEAGRTIGVPARRVDGIDANGRDRDGTPVGSLPPEPFLSEAFETAVGDQSLLRELPDGGYFLLEVTGTTPPAPRPLEAVRPAIVALWQEEERAEAAQALAETVATALSAGKPTAEVAQAHGLSVSTPEPFTRDWADADAGISQALVARVFTARPGTVVQAPSDRGVSVARLIEVVPAAADAADAGTVPAEIRAGVAGDLIDQLRDAIRDRSGVTRNQRAIDLLFPVDSGY